VDPCTSVLISVAKFCCDFMTKLDNSSGQKQYRVSRKYSIAQFLDDLLEMDEHWFSSPDSQGAGLFTGLLQPLMSNILFRGRPWFWFQSSLICEVDSSVFSKCGLSIYFCNPKFWPVQIRIQIHPKVLVPLYLFRVHFSGRVFNFVSAVGILYLSLAVTVQFHYLRGDWEC